MASLVTVLRRAAISFFHIFSHIHSSETWSNSIPTLAYRHGLFGAAQVEIKSTTEAIKFWIRPFLARKQQPVEMGIAN